jgi:hypothetical protein
LTVLLDTAFVAVPFGTAFVAVPSNGLCFSHRLDFLFHFAPMKDFERETFVYAFEKTFILNWFSIDEVGCYEKKRKNITINW